MEPAGSGATWMRSPKGAWLGRQASKRSGLILDLIKPMKTRLSILMTVLLASEGFAETPLHEKRVREVVQWFYTGFNSHGWTQVADYTTEDWNHVNPGGGWTRGRAAVLKELKEVHSTFLKGVSDTIEGIVVRFASSDVAVVTVTSRMSTFTMPDGVRHENEQHIRTFVVVRRNDHWLIMQDHNTAVARPDSVRG